MKNKIIPIILSSFLSSYLIISFCNISFDFTKWSEEYRNDCMALGCAFAFTIAFIYLLFKEQ